MKLTIRWFVDLSTCLHTARVQWYNERDDLRSQTATAPFGDFLDLWQMINLLAPVALETESTGSRLVDVGPGCHRRGT